VRAPRTARYNQDDGDSRRDHEGLTARWRAPRSAAKAPECGRMRGRDVRRYGAERSRRCFPIIRSGIVVLNWGALRRTCRRASEP